MGDSGPCLLSGPDQPLSPQDAARGGGVLTFCVNDWLDGYARAMSVLNKRNALLGWAVWNMSKRMAKQKAKSSATRDNSRLPNKRAIAAAVSALGGAVWYWRKRSHDQPH